jgi:hypothetical protein
MVIDAGEVIVDGSLNDCDQAKGKLIIKHARIENDSNRDAVDIWEEALSRSSSAATAQSFVRCDAQAST